MNKKCSARFVQLPVTFYWYGMLVDNDPREVSMARVFFSFSSQSREGGVESIIRPIIGTIFHESRL